MAKKRLSVGVKAALIGGSAVIIAALVPALLHTPSASVQPANPQFDTTLAKNYDDKFENMTHKRARAAVAIQEYLSKGDWNLVTNNTDALDEVLGFFDIMGYDEQHGSLNPDVLHEYFCDDIMAYYLASAGYIEKLQKSEGQTVYANIKPLYDIMVETEAKKEHTNAAAILWDKAGLTEYFKSETNSVNLKESK